MKKPSKSGSLDPAAICRSADPMAVRELLTKIGDKWTIFLVLSLDLLGGDVLLEHRQSNRFVDIPEEFRWQLFAVHELGERDFGRNIAREDIGLEAGAPLW
jgi:hypothetical protein